FLLVHSLSYDLLSFPTRRSSDLKCEYILRVVSTFSWPSLSEISKGGKPSSISNEACEWRKSCIRIFFTPDSLEILFNFRKMACRSEEHTSELQSRFDLVCRLLLE